MIEAFAPDETRARMADWVELSVLFSESGRASDADVLRATSVLDEPDHRAVADDAELSGEVIEEEILESGLEDRRASIWSELAFRQQVLAEAYPFELTATAQGGWVLRLRPGIADEHAAAVTAYCGALVMAAFRQGHISKRASDAGVFSDLVKRIPKLFQGLAVVASSKLLDEAYWFGWPRLDASGFLDAVKSVRDLIGLGLLREPASTTAVNLKDGTIDLIAWRRFRDHLYGALVIYGQVASGNNWRSKPLKSYLDGKFLDHFFDGPSAQHLVSMFIPFVGHDDLVAPKDRTWDETITDWSRSREKDYGLLIDRLRLAELVARNDSGPRTMHNSPAPELVLQDVDTWLGECRTYVAAAS